MNADSTQIDWIKNVALILNLYFFFRIIQVYSHKHRYKPHGEYGALGDRVLCAVKGEKIQGILVGLRANQKPGLPKFDSNNVVLIDPQVKIDFWNIGVLIF